MNNLNPECKILIINDLNTALLNLPPNLKKLYLRYPCIDIKTLQVPHGCKIIKLF